MEGDLHVVRSRTFVCISIHSLRMEGDLIEGMKQAQGITISIHSLRMEGDDTLPYMSICFVFISIHSLRMEGDRGCTNQFAIRQHFNPLPPHGGRHLPPFF